MQSRNPILTKVNPVSDFADPMTMQGTIQKSVLLAGISAAVGLAVFLFALLNSGSIAITAAIIGSLGSLILGIVLAFKSHLAKSLAIPFALCEGLFLGGISAIFQTKYPGIPAQALLATFATTLIMFGLYRYKIIKATQKFKAVVLSATLAIFAVFLIQVVMQLAFGSSIPLLFSNGPLGIGFAAFVAVIASLNLILDFDLIETSIENNAPQFMEWVSAIALLATLVWMYYSFLRLIGLLKE